MRLKSKGALIIFTAVLTGCRQQSANSTKDIIARFQKTYEGANSILIVAHIKAPPHQIKVQSWMGKERLRSEIFDGPELKDRVAIYSLHDGVFSERVYENGEPTKADYPAPKKNGTGDIKLRNDRVGPLACLFGTLTSSWIGPSNDQLQFFVDALSSSVFLRTDVQDGHECAVLKWDRSIESDPYRREDVFFVDAQRFVLLRWDTLESDDGTTPKMTRSRLYNVTLGGTVPDESAWNDLD